VTKLLTPQNFESRFKSK